MASIEVKGKDGKKVGSHTLSEALASATASAVSMHRAVVAEEAHTRQGTQKTKTRSEVRGGGRKPYKQKKTGRARAGSTRSPLWAHGGMIHALEPRDYDKKVNRKERRASTLAALAARLEGGDVTVADAIALKEPKTREALALLKAFELDGIRRVLVVLPHVDDAVYKSFRNLGNVTVRTAPGRAGDEVKTAAFSARDILVAHKILISQDALKRIEEVWAK